MFLLGDFSHICVCVCVCQFVGGQFVRRSDQLQKYVKGIWWYVKFSESEKERESERERAV